MSLEVKLPDDYNTYRHKTIEMRKTAEVQTVFSFINFGRTGNIGYLSGGKIKRWIKH